jgi:drug/metabolite transporter (DMT)-like permease
LKTSNNQPFLVVLSFLAIYIIWGSTYLVNFIAMEDIPPFLLSGMRFLLAGSIMAVIGFLKKDPLPQWQNIKSAVGMGFLFLVMGTAMVVWAEQFIDTGLAALMAAFEPVMVVLFVWLLDKRKPDPKTITGLLLGMTGIYVLVGQPEFPWNKDTFKGLFAISAAIVAWAWGTVSVKNAKLPVSKSFSASLQMIFGGLILLLFAFINNEPAHFIFQEVSTKSWLAFSYLTLAGSIIAFSAFQYLLHHVKPEKVATSNYVNPVIAVFLGWQLNNENLTSHSLLAAFLLLLGVFLVNLNLHKQN